MNMTTTTSANQPLSLSLKTGFSLIIEDHENEDITTIRQFLVIEQFSELMEYFFQSTSLGVALFDEKFEVITSVGWQKICTHFHQKHPESFKSCIESQNYFRKNFKPDEVLSLKCNNGLWDMAYPIYAGHTFLGYVGFGQFFISDDVIDKEFFIQQSQKYNFDTEAYIGQLRNIPIFPIQKLESHIILFLNLLKLNIKKVNVQ
jgi:ligand-binding sensor protein